MGTLSLERANRLLWLGRYVERAYTTQQFILAAYDASLDSVEGNWKGQLEELGFDQDNQDPQSFFHECLFAPELQASVRFSINRAFDNAVVLRDAIGTESVAYIQLAANSVDRAEGSVSPLLDLQDLVDWIMAFKGSCDDYVVNDAARNIIKCGMSIERMDLYVRLNYQLEDVRKEMQKLASRIDRTGISYDRHAFKLLVDRVFSRDFPEHVTYEGLGEMLELIAKVF